jgi:hypothetical protein
MAEGGPVRTELFDFNAPRLAGFPEPPRFHF